MTGPSVERPPTTPGTRTIAAYEWPSTESISERYAGLLVAAALLPVVAIAVITACRLQNTTSPDRTVQAVRSRILLRARVSGGTFCMGWMLLVFSLVSFMLDTLLTSHPTNSEGFQLAPFPLGLVVLLFALMPADDLAIYCTCLLCGALELAFATTLLHIAISGVSVAPPHSATIYCLGAILNVLNPLLVLGPALRCGMAPRARLRRFWIFIRVAFIISACFCSLEAYRKVRANVDFQPDLMVAISSFLAAAMTASQVRARIFRGLANLGVPKHSEMQSAAVIAYLMGGSSTAKVISQAARLFYVIPLARVDAMDIQALEGMMHEGMVGLIDTVSVKRRQGVFGECDAFVSHSHQDDADAKLAAIQELDQDLLGEDKTIWLDTACMIRGEIDESLRCLPVFVSGCKNLAVLIGPTYYRRLWCILEVFTFVQLGGTRERIIAKTLDDEQSLHSLLENFSVSTAEATRQEDLEGMLGVIESSFGTLSAFDAAMRHFLSVQSNHENPRSRQNDPRLLSREYRGSDVDEVSITVDTNSTPAVAAR